MNTISLNIISATTKIILATEEMLISSHYKGDLRQVISANTTAIFATEEVTSATLKVISATTIVILAIEEAITATLKGSQPIQK